MASPYAMVVEDDPQIAALFQLALQDAGYQTEIMDNGHKAQANLVFTAPDLVLLDLHLPSLDGSVLLRQIRSQHRLMHTRIILVTGDAAGAQRFAGQVDSTLHKPVGYEEVHRVARELMPVFVVSN
ncbi:MAG: response regulator [Anaerolineales bacterium]|nr:response regulator [Anaerolineales bacterium]